MSMKFRSQGGKQRLHAIVLGALLLLGLDALPGAAQTYTPYTYFENLSISDLGRVQVKFTYLGMQNIGVATVAFAVPANPMNLALFEQFRHAGFEYGNDRLAAKSFSVTAQELKAMIDSVGTSTEIIAGPAESNGEVSFALLDTLDGVPKVFEAIVGTAEARELFGKVIPAFGGNGDAFRGLRGFACSFGALPVNGPTNVDSRVSVHFSGVRADRAMKNRFVGRVRITNTSGTTIQAPLTLLVLITGNAALIGADGFSCRLAPVGRPFLLLSAATDLAPGATIEKTLRFTNPSLEKFSVSSRVFSGPGTP